MDLEVDSAWKARDDEYHKVLSESRDEAANAILAMRLQWTETLNELEYVRTTFIDETNVAHDFLYRRRKIQVQLDAAKEPDEFTEILKYVEACIRRAKNPTDETHYINLWNDTLGGPPPNIDPL